MRDVTPMTQKATDGRPEVPGLEAGLSVCAKSLSLSMIFSDLPSLAEASFAKARNRFTLFGIML